VTAEALSGFWKVVRGAKWKQSDYVSLLVLLHGLTRRARQGGLIAIEDDIERPDEAQTFKAVPRILADKPTTALICDTFRLMALDLSNTRRANEAMERSIERHYETRMRAVNALHTVADALPALGIVAAVIGIIRTMGVIDQAPSVVGAMMAAALLGTFLGVFLAYGLVGPVATRFGQIIEEEERFLQTVRAVLSAYGEGLAPLTAIELGRAEVPDDIEISADDLARVLQAARFEARRAAAA
jgi:chemotaxis protein MotA